MSLRVLLAAAVLSIAAPALAEDPPAPEPQPLPESQPPPETQVPVDNQPPPQPLLPPSTCCRWSVRFDPFQIIFRRLSIEGEVKIAGPFSLGVEPGWIFGSSTDNLDEKGFAFLGFFGWTFSGPALRGFWLRAVAGFDAFDATLTHAQDKSAQAKKTIATGVFGLMIGDSVVFGHDGGFTLSGGIGIGVATADKTTLTAHSTNKDLSDTQVTYYDDLSRIKLLGSTGIGVTF